MISPMAVSSPMAGAAACMSNQSQDGVQATCEGEQATCSPTVAAGVVAAAAVVAFQTRVGVDVVVVVVAAAAAADVAAAAARRCL